MTRIVVTGAAGFIGSNIIKGLNAGADDYITKPFDEEELLWKIRAVMRRIPEFNNEDRNEPINIGLYEFDFYNQSLIFDGVMRRITVKESEILRYLSVNRNKVIKREDMLIALWGKNDYFYGRSLDVFITKIRKYLKEDPELSVENIFSVGFIFNVPD